jgi:glycosyltransferase involved in cell wall biosynthesis
VKQAFTGGILCSELAESKTVAVVTLWSGGMTWSGCVESLLRFTSEDIPICVWDDGGPSMGAIEELQKLEGLLSREVFYFRQGKNLGVVGNLNHAFATFVNSDVIVLNSDIIVGPNWDLSLVEAASSRTDVATVTSLCNGRGLFGVGEIQQLGKRVPTVDEFAALSEKVRNNSKKIRPVVPTATSFCTLFTRQALNIVGQLDPEFSPGYGEEVDFSLRCSAYGFVHLADDNTLVFHATGESFGDTTQNARKQLNDELVSRRYGYWQPFIDTFLLNSDSTLARALIVAKTALIGLKFIIDAEKIHPDLTGTFEGSSRLINALWQNPKVHSVTLLAPLHSLERLQEWSRTQTNSAIQVISMEEVEAEQSFDIALRPYQDYSGETWPQVKRLARRNIVWHLDLIATHNPTYSADFESYKQLTTAVVNSLDEADAIGVLTKHVEEDLLSTYGGKGLEEKMFILENGPTQTADSGMSTLYSSKLLELDEEPYILVIGTNYRHKNLTWLMRVFLMVRELGWVGRMVVIGPTPTVGGTEEVDRLLAESTLPSAFRFLGRVEDSEKNLVLRGAKLVVVPSITEGWGLVPVEAALEGVPAVTSIGGGLRDVKPENAISLSLASDYESAKNIHKLLTEPICSKTQLETWLNKSSQLSWANSAEALVAAASNTLAKASWLNRSNQEHSLVADSASSYTSRKSNESMNHLVFSLSRKLFPLDSQRREMLKKTFPKIRHYGTDS